MAKTIVFPTQLNETIVANALTSLREANKESHSISGAIRQMGASWGKGYDKAFSIFGFTKATFTPANIFAVLAESQKTTGEEGATVCKIWQKEYDKVVTRSKNGGTVKTVYKLYKGKKVFRYVQKDIKAWTPTVLFELLVQAVNQGAMPAYPDYLAQYWEGVDAAKVIKQEIVANRPISVEPKAPKKGLGKHTPKAKDSKKKNAA